MLKRGFSGVYHASALVSVLALSSAATAASSTTSAPTIGATNPANDSLFQVDSRNPVDNKTGNFFDGLPIPAFGYSLRVSVLGQYDSNFLRLPDGVATPPNLSKNNFRLTPSVSGSINLPLGRQAIFGSVLFGKDFYKYDQGYDRQRILLSAGANLAAGSSCTANLNLAYVEQQSNNNSSLVNLPNTQTSTSYGASATCGGLSGFTPSVSYRHSSASNGDPLRVVNDLTTDSYSVSVGYARPTLGVISLFGSLANSRYPNQTIVVGQQTLTRGVDVTNFGASYQRTFGTTLSVNASISNVKVVPTTVANQPSQNGLGYGLGVNYNPPSRLSAGVNASRNASSSPNSVALFFVQQAFSAYVNYELRSSLSASLSASTSLRDYSNSLPVPGLQTLQSDRVNNLRFSINWQPMTNMQTRFFVAQTNRSADPSIYNYKDTSAGFVISYGI
ncbi:MAG: hypothetical protein ACRCUI_00385 [Polymorphobacter sp.]